MLHHTFAGYIPLAPSDFTIMPISLTQVLLIHACMKEKPLSYFAVQVSEFKQESLVHEVEWTPSFFDDH